MAVVDSLWLAEYLGCSRRTVSLLAKRGWLTAVKDRRGCYLFDDEIAGREYDEYLKERGRLSPVEKKIVKQLARNNAIWRRANPKEAKKVDEAWKVERAERLAELRKREGK